EHGGGRRHAQSQARQHDKRHEEKPRDASQRAKQAVDQLTPGSPESGHAAILPGHASLRASAQAPAASATAAYPHSRPNETGADSECATGLTAVIEFSAIIIGRNLSTACCAESPSGTITSGSTNSTPTTAQIAPAVCRMMAPSASPISATRA